MTIHFINNLQVDLTNCKSYCHSCCCCCWCTSCCCWPGPWWWWWWSWSPICTSDFFHQSWRQRSIFNSDPFYFKSSWTEPLFPSSSCCTLSKMLACEKELTSPHHTLLSPTDEKMAASAAAFLSGCLYDFHAHLVEGYRIIVSFVFSIHLCQQIIHKLVAM